MTRLRRAGRHGLRTAHCRFPGSVRDNVLYGPRLAGERNTARMSEIIERSLTQAALWAEVKDRLDSPALSLSGGQQQRLCIARSLALGAGGPPSRRAYLGVWIPSPRPRSRSPFSS